MKRMLLAALATSMLALFAPAIAAAQHRHHHRGHARVHKGHAKTSRLLVFGSASVLAPSSTTTPIVKPEPEKAGTIESFKEGPANEGVLTIKLADESKVTGKVTRETQIRCPTPPPEAGDNDEEEGSDDDQGGAQSDQRSARSESGSFGSRHGDVMAHSACHHSASSAEHQTSCTTASLVAGAVVLAAELKLTPTGAVWEQVALG